MTVSATRLADIARPADAQGLGSVWIDALDARSGMARNEVLLAPWCLCVFAEIGPLLEPLGDKEAHFHRIGAFYLLRKGVGWFAGSRRRKLTIL
jgi:hypothetical protein